MASSRAACRSRCAACGRRGPPRWRARHYDGDGAVRRELCRRRGGAVPAGRGARATQRCPPCVVWALVARISDLRPCGCGGRAGAPGPARKPGPQHRRCVSWAASRRVRQRAARVRAVVGRQQLRHWLGLHLLPLGFRPAAHCGGRPGDARQLGGAARGRARLVRVPGAAVAADRLRVAHPRVAEDLHGWRAGLPGGCHRVGLCSRLAHRGRDVACPAGRAARPHDASPHRAPHRARLLRHRHRRSAHGEHLCAVQRAGAQARAAAALPRPRSPRPRDAVLVGDRRDGLCASADAAHSPAHHRCTDAGDRPGVAVLPPARQDSADRCPGRAAPGPQAHGWLLLPAAAEAEPHAGG
mmetsp:Transcript_48033/g.120318  ORF Transcript_48033/g.120318 Transcript_48033/m.120318 type:complete len:355 (+) Transcript_48033:765-1829(+)